MIITGVRAHHLVDVPTQPPPFRDEPSRYSAILVEVRTDDGHVGWALAGFSLPLLVTFVNEHLAGELIGEDPLRTEWIWRKLSDPRPEARYGHRRYGRLLVHAMSCIDIALWDIRGKAVGMPVHRLLGGARDRVPVYVTHGAAYGDAPPYTPEELAAEARHLVDRGVRQLKNTVGRQLRDGEFAPDPDDDAVRMRAIRDAVGPDVPLGMDGNCRMSAPEAIRLCHLTDELGIAFLEEPVVDNDPALLAAVRRQVAVPIAAAENHAYAVRDYLLADAVDLVQPNVCKDGGYTGALRIASAARAFNVPLSHGNGGGLYNLALHAGLGNGAVVEYHYHHWMGWNEVFAAVPQPVDGYVEVPQGPGFGIEPNPGVIEEYGARS